MRNLKLNNGFTLIELMIAITISVILLNGVLQIFQSSKQSYRIADNLGRTQENARYALGVLAQEIRQVGFLPCRIAQKSGQAQVTNVLTNNANEFDFFGAPITGFEGGASVFPAELQAEGSTAGTRLVGSDGFRILRGGGSVYSVTQHNPTAAQLKINTINHNINPGDILMVCDTESAAIFQASNSNPGTNNTIVHNTGTGTPGNCTKGLGIPQPNVSPCASGVNGTSKTFGPDSQVVKFTSSVYYIGASVATDGDALPTNSLYRREQANITGNIQFGPPQELVQGIETMQIIYGVALPIVGTNDLGTAVRYVTADNVAANEWANVVSVRVGLLFHTPEEISTAVDTTTYNVVGTTITSTSAVAYPADRRQRYIFSETIKIRNRGASVAAPPSNIILP